MPEMGCLFITNLLDSKLQFALFTDKTIRLETILAQKLSPQTHTIVFKEI